MIHYSLIGYVMACAISLFLSWMAYRFFLESKCPARKNRVFILSIYGLMFLTPLLIPLFPLIFSVPSIKTNPIGNIILEEGFAELITEGQSQNNIYPIVLGFYGLGVVTMILITIINILKLWRVYKNSKKKEIYGIRIFLHNDKELSSYSWMNKIFLFRETESMTAYDKVALILHEQAHIKNCHYIDLIIAQSVMIFQWFNPAAWLIRKELQRLHEYEADATVLEYGVDEISYQNLLIDNISRYQFSGLTDGLNNCSLKKRIIMMQTKKFKKKIWLRFAIVIVAAMTAGSIIKIPVMASVMENKYSSDSQNSISESINNISEENLVLSSDKTESNLENGIYKATQITPAYGGSVEQQDLLYDLSEVIRYPENASKNAVQGRVVVKFVIRKNGDLDNFQIVRSVDPELDNEAIRAIKSLPKRWVPGYIDGNPVDSYFFLPVVFSLGNQNNKEK